MRRRTCAIGRGIQGWCDAQSAPGSEYCYRHGEMYEFTKEQTEP